MKILGITIPSEVAKLCTPAQVYLVLSLISVLIYIISMINVHDTVLEAEPEGGGVHHYTMGGLLVKVLFTLLWIYILNYICKFKHGKKIAWFIVLLPFFFMGLMLIGMLCAVSFIALQSKKTKGLENQLVVEKKKQIQAPVLGPNGAKKAPVQQIGSELLR
jgi:hypothetical protein